MIVPVSTRNGNLLLYMHASFVLIMYLLFAIGFARLRESGNAPYSPWHGQSHLKK
jgi:hypothetical protein